MQLPARALKDVFADLASSQNVQVHWLVVNATAMNVDHNPQDDVCEDRRWKRCPSGKSTFEACEENVYRYAGAITLSSDCLKCHVPNRRASRIARPECSLRCRSLAVGSDCLSGEREGSPSMHTRQVALCAAFLIAAVSNRASRRCVADETWKQPLAQKEQVIEEGIRKRHNIQGLYPSMVEIPRVGDSIDTSTTNPFADIQHAVCWTSNYLAGLSYKYALLRDSHAPEEVVRDAKRRVDEVFEAVYRCQLVTGVRGLQARGYLLGHGETYAERENSSKLPFWRQGLVDGQAYRWVGDPSHHNYSDAIHGLGQYYTLAAEGPQKDRAREAIDALVSYWVDNDLRIAEFDRIAANRADLGYHRWTDAQYARVHGDWPVRRWPIMRRGRRNFDKSTTS